MAGLDFKENQGDNLLSSKRVFIDKNHSSMSQNQGPAATIIPPDILAQSLKGMILDPNMF